MNNDKLNRWAELLLDTGKRNNLINFKDTKTGVVEIVSPNIEILFSKIDHSVGFEVYDPRLADDEEDEASFNAGENENEKDGEEDRVQGERISKENYVKKYGNSIKNNQVLVYNSYVNPLSALYKIGKRAKLIMEETGVNDAYMAFGFIHWSENENSQYVMRAPILLIPVYIECYSALTPYYIRVADSDIIVNPTFSFKLKSDYGLDLPEYCDEDIETYLEKVQHRFSKLKWKVSKECKIAIFSFLKNNMYEDVKNHAEIIMENGCVRALLGERSCNNEMEDSTGDNDTDNNLSPTLHNVVDADSSQTEAIEMACSGKSFVLQGPPGTGKSQTITNIIAESLACGKKVLFVSEKSAALNVVYNNLKKAGLDEFCLELHSYKANKKDVINELCRSLTSGRSILAERAQKETEERLCVQRQLDDYAEELHKVRPTINKTLYSLYEEVSACRKAPDIEFVITDIKTKGEEHIDKAEVVLKRYTEYVPSIGYDYHQNIWYGYRDLDLSYQSIAQLKSDLKNVITFCDNIKELNVILSKKYSIQIENLKQAHIFKEFFNLIKASGFITPALFNVSVVVGILKTIDEIKTLSGEIIESKKNIDDVFDEEIYKLDGQSLYKKLTKQYNRFFSRIFSSEYRHIAKELKHCKTDGKKVKYEVAVSTMNTLAIYQKELRRFNETNEKIKPVMGSAYNGYLTNFNALIYDIETLRKIQSNDVDFSPLTVLNNQEFIAKQKEFEDVSECLENMFSRFEEAEKRIADKYDSDVYDILLVKIDDLVQKFRGCLDAIDKLDNWCEFSKLLIKLDNLGLKTFVDYAIACRINADDFSSAYKKTFYMQWIDVVLRESPVLTTLSRVKHDETIKLFQTKDKLNFEISKAQIKARLFAQRPDMEYIAPGSAVAVLLREGQKKRKQMGVRTLLDIMGELTLRLKPCFLMSPLSVSTFLSSNIRFDVVIFDEASQIFPQDAIGAIYRGKQLIVVGDSKQMPPSNFFTSSSSQDDDDDSSEDITDFESILDICSTVFPQKCLKWHYRSRCEQLIAFSNKNFYNNELVTFPSSRKDTKGIGVDYYHVNGIFDRKTRENYVEAEKVVDLVFENIEKHPERSLGVVAFSNSQQDLIDKLITKRRQQDPSKEPIFSPDKSEPFFVKNLETVQGDERDTIIFSIAYAQDSQGRLIYNFGPLNRDGGERRLNVAVTRAKYNIQLVSSLHCTDIDLSRTQSAGARLLREYLDYAENGKIALERSISANPFEKYDSEFEMEVCEFLREKGFTVDTQVGCSSFKIDLALKRPKSSDYLLAIECDGATYHSSRNARDRDRLRQEILEGMGWKFYRIWSTDWFRNKSVEKERLLEAAKSAVENAKITSEETYSKDISFEEIVEVKHFEFPEYVMANEIEIAHKTNNRYTVICSIVDIESPISEEWLLKRIAFIFGRKKVTNALREEFNVMISYSINYCSNYKIERRNGFLYAPGKEIPMLRVPKKNPSVIREIKYIAPEELALGMKEIIKQNVTVDKNGLFYLIAKQLGFALRGNSILNCFEEALSLLSNEIDINGDTLSLKHVQKNA